MKSRPYKASLDLFDDWRSRLERLSAVQSRFESWLFVQVAGVLFGGKSGELVIVKKGAYGLGVSQVAQYCGEFCSSWQINYKVLVDTPHSLKLIMYRIDAVERRLQRASKKFLHCYLRYPFGLTPKTFLHEVGCRWKQTGSVPHEIGIALGYPLKDVWGFMGFRRCRCRGSCGWQIFGDPSPSLKMRARFDEARRTAVRLLEAA
ncbi:DUF3793 family protein [Prosthecochloris sp. N3]|uniref:DUF3793 family protein n=1 Tax=Prosthecochloris ethylica TaxID=2743976 RepID=A0ABR9XQ83_9CHLB|nr:MULTISPECIES: DUF3793 family protein [Prosthecochloris]MBF0587259.1 DUF3793 family protein [Prosthecochloris ethylica]MBF0636047.1 DUF3793 family protein [Prosthecochloris ethylica]NUK48474.1 DUF3793 family protein [Prosthecochloris ethylica]RNA64459.1 DUF3793 family protein [Prosthecochloris sp. ZM_2]